MNGPIVTVNTLSDTLTAAIVTEFPTLTLKEFDGGWVLLMDYITGDEYAIEVTKLTPLPL